MAVGVEHVTVLRGIEALQAVLRQHLHEDVLGHLEAAVQVHEVLVVAVELLGRHGAQGAVEVVDAVEQLFGEALQGEVLGCLDFALGLLLEVAVIRNGALQSVL